MQTNYDFRQARGLEGFRADAGRPHDVDSWHNPINAQTNTATFGGTPTNGNYDIVIEQPGANPVVARVARVAGTPVDDTALGVAMALEINTNRAFQNLVTATEVTGVVTLAFIHPGIVYTVTSLAPAPGTLVIAQTGASGGSFQRVGMMVARDSSVAGQDRRILPITTSTVAANIVGIAEATFHLTNGVDLGLDFDAWQPGQEVPLGLSGRWNVRVSEAVTPASVVHMWRDEADPTFHVGQLGATTQGGSAISLASLPMRYIESAVANGIAVVQLGFGA